jgi:hypothetical protein
MGPIWVPWFLANKLSSVVLSPQVQSTYLTTPIQLEDTWASVSERLSTRKILAPLAEIKGTGTGRGMLGLLESQVSDVGLPTWAPPVPTAAFNALDDMRARDKMLMVVDGAVMCPAPSSADAVVAIEGTDGHNACLVKAASGQCDQLVGFSFFELGDLLFEYLEAWAISTDAGQDISTGRDMMHASCWYEFWRLVFDNDCFAHQYHLICKGFLGFLRNSV